MGRVFDENELLALREGPLVEEATIYCGSAGGRFLHLRRTALSIATSSHVNIWQEGAFALFLALLLIDILMLRQVRRPCDLPKWSLERLREGLQVLGTIYARSALCIRSRHGTLPLKVLLGVRLKGHEYAWHITPSLALLTVVVLSHCGLVCAAE